MTKGTFNRTKKMLVILLTVFFISASTGAVVSAKTVNVDIKDLSFKPASVKISTGDTVKWTNRDKVDHTVTGSTFKSGKIHSGKSFKFKFTKPGVFKYMCSIHPFMKGTVKVVASKPTKTTSKSTMSSVY